MTGDGIDAHREELGQPEIEPRAATPDLKLRGEIPRVMRLSRKTIGIGSAVILTGIGGLFTYALQSTGDAPPTELYSDGGTNLPDGLSGAPKDYSQVPQLGPPLPGDLGAPILAAAQRGDIAELPPIGTPPPSQTDPTETARQLALQEREAARLSRLFLGGVNGSERGASAPTTPFDLRSALAANDTPSTATEEKPPTSGFLQRTGNRQTISSERLSMPVDPNIIQAGSIISAALITGIRSDLPGQITAQVTQNVYDSPTGRILLIPQGSRLIGEYDADVTFGQNRVLLVWDRLILPDGRSLVLNRQPGADTRGFAGLQDRTNYHWGNVIKAALISTLLGIGAETGSGSDHNLTRALRRGTQDGVNQAGQKIVSRELDIKPTLTIRPGFPVRVIVTRDLVLAPIGERR
ncbi:TrbI/VirB10 family protein [Sphingorhabdus sp. YGSMI21]|uniref:TrbI/VirB10 family protein n=1 Tax=Sphingorhabdus sp. YGSMI21 TaxID=2077182 RepID=UPI000C1E5D57|nr:TrbI/VirB10 family protein [Sphingorhabdus sp. YGSMI21]ATW05280.1 conjugal transfer protein TraI [Sphingorhabdus sp. YGSMI21]